MLLIDGVRYELWTLPNEDEFERVVKEHTQDIFGGHSIYLDLKQKLRSKSGIGSIPDGYVIIFGDSPCWHIVEIELSSHPLYEHIVQQVSRFINGIKNFNTQREITNAIYEEIDKDDFLKLKVRRAIEPIETYRFLADLISRTPVVTIIIEKHTEGLDEALSALAHPQIKIVEFQTFVREGVSFTVHAHQFEPVIVPRKPSLLPPPTPPRPPEERRKAGKVTFQELVGAGLLTDGQVLYFHHTRPFVDERAQVVASSNELRYEADGRTYSTSGLAKALLIKHGFKHDEYGVWGPKYWKTEDGRLLHELNEQIRIQRGDRVEV